MRCGWEFEKVVFHEPIFFVYLALDIVTAEKIDGNSNVLAKAVVPSPPFTICSLHNRRLFQGGHLPQRQTYDQKDQNSSTRRDKETHHRSLRSW